MSGRQNTRQGEGTVIPDKARRVTAFLARQRAIEDGKLLDVSRLAKCVGYCIPVAMSTAVIERYVLVHEDDAWDDERSRVWGILNSLAHSIPRMSQAGHYFVWVEPNVAKSFWLRVVVVKDKYADPVMTIMLPEQE